MNATKEMTWAELNTLTDDMLPDAIGPQWQEFVDDGADEDPIYNCQALEIIIEVLEEITGDSQCPENYSQIIPALRRVR